MRIKGYFVEKMRGAEDDASDADDTVLKSIA